ncbi:hypothetical protein ABZZ79_03450 [Streptomyces sp. NPDC006458]|uniref:hypothetical protein n=1 Tax=Streptomyces sp. NPDC006458 TaxID=3154302 RepID=UPI0033BE633C
MSTVTSTAEWVRCGGIGVGAWAVIAVLVKAAADAPPRTQPAPAKTEAPAAVPPMPAFPPSTARHAGMAAAEEQLLLTPSVSLIKAEPSWI